MKPGFLLSKSEKKENMQSMPAKPLILKESNFSTLQSSDDFRVRVTREMTAVSASNNGIFSVKIENGKVIMTRTEDEDA